MHQFKELDPVVATMLAYAKPRKYIYSEDMSKKRPFNFLQYETIMLIYLPNNKRFLQSRLKL